MLVIPWIILFLPLAAAAGITLFTLKNRGLSAGLSIGAVVIAFVLSCVTFLHFRSETAPVESSVCWLSVVRFLLLPRPAPS